jgi:hypothetical protein
LCNLPSMFALLVRRPNFTVDANENAPLALLLRHASGLQSNCCSTVGM